jgi:molybdate transport system ATP-binding protein
VRPPVISLKTKALISLDDVALRVGDRRLLDHTDWRIDQGQNWVIWGPNGAGKTTLAKALLGTVAVVQGRIRRHYEAGAATSPSRPAVALVSPEQYHDLYRRERLLDEMHHFSGRFTEGTCGHVLLADREHTVTAEPSDLFKYIDTLLGLKALLDTPLDALSSGETTKLLLARALVRHPRLLILDEPFNGLDPASQKALTAILVQLSGAGTQMILITHRLTEIHPIFEHIIRLDRGMVTWQGTADEFRASLAAAPSPDPTEAMQHPRPEMAVRKDDDPDVEVLLSMRKATVKYGDRIVLDAVDWTVRAGENWALIGPNGAGKSTLLNLITGDNLQGYANDLVLFGHRKGSGQSVWEIKRFIGVVGDVLQARYQRTVSGYNVVCSGFFDSVGLYRRCSAEQRRMARQWIDILGLADLAPLPFARLSFGQQRLILIARAMVKAPRLLILDEPCNGLDSGHRVRLLALLDRIGQEERTNLLYVSHRPDEIPACITHRLFLQAGRATIDPDGLPQTKNHR